MPQMRKSIDPSKGAILEVTANCPLSLAHPGTISLTRNIDLLIDTGAEDSFIYHSVVTALLLPFRGVRDIGSANNSELTTANLIDIVIPGARHDLQRYRDSDPTKKAQKRAWSPWA